MIDHMMWSTMVEKLARAYAKIDPERLLHMGAPQDEYEGEALEVISTLAKSTGLMLSHDDNQDMVRRVVFDVFYRMFGTIERIDDSYVTPLVDVTRSVIRETHQEYLKQFEELTQ